MSNLGVVYEVDTKKNMINKYPVVYSNKTLYYCKEYGTDELRRFYKKSCYSLDAYYRKCEENNTFFGLVFADSKDKIDFPKVPREIALTVIIEELKKELNIRYTAIERYKNNIKEAQKQIESISLLTKEIEKRILCREEELLNLKKEKS